MNGPEKVARRLHEMQTQIERQGRASQLGNTTIRGAAAVAVADVVTESAVTNDALPDVQDDVADASESASDLTTMFDSFDEDMEARFEDARAELDDKAAEIEATQQIITDAFGQQFDGMSEDIQTAIRAAGAAQGTADGIPLILFSTVRGPSNMSDLAPTGSTWFYLDPANNIAGQWQQTGPKATPTWTPQQIVSDVIANLDLGKLTAGQAAIAELVAMKIAASTANFQTVNVSNLFVTSGATMSQATIDYLFANVVQAKKITASMIDVNSLNGITLTGTTVRTAASGGRIELTQSSVGGTTAFSQGALQFFQNNNTNALVLRPGPVPADGSLVLDLGSVTGGVFNYSRIAAFEAYSPTPNDPYFNADGNLQLFRSQDTHSLFLDDTSGPWGSLKVKKAVIESITHPTTGRVLVGTTDWITPDIVNAINDSTVPFRYRLHNGMVVFEGLLNLTSSSINATVFQLPLGFRPQSAKEQGVNRGTGGAATLFTVRVQAGGNVAMLGPSGGSGSVQMSNFTPFIADR